MRFYALLPGFLLLTVAACAPEEQPSAEAGPPIPDTRAILDTPPTPDTRAGEVVTGAIDAAGGWEAWEAVPGLSYDKHVTTFDSTGAVIRQRVERHYYALNPGPRMRITYADQEGREVLVINDGRQAWKWIDGERATSEEHGNNAWNSTFGSHYVMGMPFKLLDPGTHLNYAGTNTVNGVPVNVIDVEYEEGAGSSGGMHQWTYYFAVDDARLVANHLTYGPGLWDHDLTVYDRLTQVGEIVLPMERRGYRSTAEKDMLWQTSRYENRNVSLDSLPDSLFLLPASR